MTSHEAKEYLEIARQNIAKTLKSNDGNEKRLVQTGNGLKYKVENFTTFSSY